jgi:hypothetical protein
MKRTASTSASGRFYFPQLQPGEYSVKVEAEGFEPQQNESVSSALGQTQTVNFTLQLAESQQTVRVIGEAAILNPDDVNTSTTLTAHALENLPNPGARWSIPRAAAMISWAARMATAMWSSTAYPRFPTDTSSTAWRPTIRSPI